MEKILTAKKSSDRDYPSKCEETQTLVHKRNSLQKPQFCVLVINLNEFYMQKVYYSKTVSRTLAIQFSDFSFKF